MIPVNEPLIGDEEKNYVLDCLQSGWISSEGPYVAKFENAFANYIGKSAGIAVCNGTAAVETALYAAGVKSGDEVILPTFTIISCLLAVVRLGAKPILVDIEPDTWNMNVQDIQSKITSRTKAILAVHIYGHPVDMDPLMDIANKYNISIIEDAAQVHGAEYKGRKCGSIGVVSAFSFYANKLVTTGEGGMVLTSDPSMELRARSYRNLCFNAKERFLHDDIGYNFRMTALQAAIGLGQLQRIEQIVARKRLMGKLYSHYLSSISGLQLQSEKPWAKTVYWMYALQLCPSLGKTAKELMVLLAKRGIGTRPFFRGLHDQPILKNSGIVRSTDSYPVADAAYKYGLYLPSSLSLAENQIIWICEQVKDLLFNSVKTI